MAKKKQSGKKKPAMANKGQPASAGCPLLSIGIIFKNDIRCIEKCLKALQPLREAVHCQLVMADTGSTDGSRAVAEQYADILIDFPWINDFSAARNAVMDRCTGLWYLTVDTDEYLDPDIAHFVDFLTGPRRYQYERASVVQRNYHTREMLEGDHSDFAAPRMARLDTGARYVNPIHEAFCLAPEGTTKLYMPHVILHHDGYAGDRNGQKQRRNLPLLEEQLAEEPGSLRTVTLCLDSSYTRDQARKYTRMGVELVKKKGEDWDLFGDVLMETVVATAINHGFSEWREWGELARSLFPDSPKTLVDVSFHQACGCGSDNDYEGILRYGATYWEGLRRFDAGEFDLYLAGGHSFLRATPIRCRQQTAVTECVAHAGLKRWEEALKGLEALPMKDFAAPKDIRNYMIVLLTLWRESNLDSRPLLRREYEELWADRDNGALGRERWKTFRDCCRAAFNDPKDELMLRPAAGLFAPLGEGCDLGRFGLLLETEDVSRVEELLGSIEDWDNAPVQVVEHAIALDAPFPESFYRRNAETVEFHGEQLMELYKDEPETMVGLLYHQHSVGGDGPGAILWRSRLTMAAAKRLDWEKEEPAQALAELFGGSMAACMDLYYQPALLTEETLYLLPAQFRFVWHYLRAGEAWDSGDYMGYVKELRQGARFAPELGDMVKFLSKQVEEAIKPENSAQKELLELADKVRAVLAQYPADDPVVDQLKQSAAYQKVAHLLG